jgi:hypothetical protein
MHEHLKGKRPMANGNVFNGQCKIDRQGDILHATMTLPTPTGPITWEDAVRGDVDDPLAETRLLRKAAFVAGFFPTAEMVGQEVIGQAESVYRSYLDPSTRAQAWEQIQGVDHDTRYALDRIVGAQVELVGWSLKKFGKKLGKGIKKVARVAPMAVFPPLAAVALVKAARRKNPAAIKKIRAVRTVALSPINRVADVIRPIGPNTPPVTLPQAVQVQEQAQEALQNLENANAIVQYQEQPQYQPQYERAAQYDSPEETWQDPDSSFEETVDSYDPRLEADEEDVGTDWYEDGALAGEGGMSEDEIAGLFDLAKKIGKGAKGLGRMIDPTKPGSMTGGALSAIPGIGPAVKASLDLTAKAKAGMKGAKDKIKTIQQLAKAGVPKAKDAMANLSIADKLQKDIEKGGRPWYDQVRIPFSFAAYDRGAAVVRS